MTIFVVDVQLMSLHQKFVVSSLQQLTLAFVKSLAGVASAVGLSHSMFAVVYMPNSFTSCPIGAQVLLNGTADVSTFFTFHDLLHVYTI